MCSERKIINKPLILGLTGGIGSGKSTVAKIFTVFGAKVYNSDFEAKKLINEDKSVIDAIQSFFGKDMYNQNGFDAHKMSRIVFNNKEALQQLNSIVHPKVKAHFENWVKHHSSEKLLIKEAAILIESGAYKGVDKILVVIAPTDVKIKRIMQRDNITVEEINKRMDSQMCEDEKLKFADFVISNNEKDLVIPQVFHIFKQLTID